MNLDNVHLVLVQTSEPQNLGAVARVMRNCELSRLTLVEPRTDDLVTARRVAVHAEELLAAPRTVSTLAE
ncbi:MAG TPA: rRNA methyltransferase, partial [Myxococcales bacterium]|nr:rRNA methyltransferase [Myxococcales bacterium]